MALTHRTKCACALPLRFISYFVLCMFPAKVQALKNMLKTLTQSVGAAVCIYYNETIRNEKRLTK